MRSWWLRLLRYARPEARGFALLLLLTATACDRSPPAPAQPVALSFVGSATCRECHAPRFELWQQSHHALAMQEATSATVLGDFSGVAFDYFDSLHVTVTTSFELTMQMVSLRTLPSNTLSASRRYSSTW